tara:strand:+ start:1858 stop:2388 length:531 start_codon:yes stop_codon:yes gene_type:complete
MKYPVRFFVIILITFCFSIANANETLSIVYINMEKVMNKSLAGKSLIEQLDKIHQSNIEEFKKSEASIKADENKIMSQKNILSEEEFNKKINLLKVKVDNYKKYRKSKIDNVAKMKVEATNKFFQKLNPILTDYSKKNNISIILRRKDIVIAKTDLDITENIIVLIDSKIKEIDLN